MITRQGDSADKESASLTAPMPARETLAVSASRRLQGITGLDRAIAFTVVARTWSSAAGLITVLLVARFLTPAEQGYYYTFGSLVALQVVFELGFSYVILQIASHERAHVSITPDYDIRGDQRACARLASVLRKSLQWYSIGAVLMVTTILWAGTRFFATHQHGGPDVGWRLAWYLVVLMAGLTFQLDPMLAFLEGCGFVANVAALRFRQAVIASCLAWGALFFHRGLFAPAMLIAGNAGMALIWLFGKRKLIFRLLRYPPGNDGLHWMRDVWPFQWRIAVSWLCGYCIFQLFNPVLFAYQGPVIAGQMGMSLSIATAISAVAISWMSTKSAPFGTLVARRDFDTLDRVFFRTLKQSTIVVLVAAAAIVIFQLYATRHFPGIAARVLDPWPFALLLAATVANHVVSSEAIYLRAHKREPFLLLSVLVGLLVGGNTLVAGKYLGASAVATGYFIFGGVVALVVATATFVSKRRAWHARVAAAGHALSGFTGPQL